MFSVKWQIRDYNDQTASSLDAASSVTFAAYTCGAFSAASDEITSYVTGASDLKYDPETSQYIYKWQATRWHSLNSSA